MTQLIPRPPECDRDESSIGQWSLVEIFLQVLPSKAMKSVKYEWQISALAGVQFRDTPISEQPPEGLSNFGREKYGDAAVYGHRGKDRTF